MLWHLLHLLVTCRQWTLAIGNPGFAYTEPPSFTFGGPGAGAAATASITNSGITSIRITQPGFNYVSPPTITVQHPSDVGIGTTGATVGIKTGQVQATAQAVLDGDELQNILILNAGSGYEGTPTVTISAPLNAGVGTYFGNERVVGSVSGTEGYVKKWDLANRQLQISINTGAFLPGELLRAQHLLLDIKSSHILTMILHHSLMTISLMMK